MPDSYGCEGSCPVCRLGEVENHKCNRCRFEFCPVCHGTMPKYKAENVLPCLCSRNIFAHLWEMLKSRMRKGQAKLVAKKISELPPDNLLEYLDTGRAEINLVGKILEVMPLRDEVLNEIQGTCVKYGFIDQEEIIKKFKERFGILCSRAARREILLLVEDGIIKKEKERGKNILKLF